MKGFGHLAQCDMQGRGENVARTFPAKLDDVLAEIRFDNRHIPRLQERVQLNLLGDHGLALGYVAGAGGLADVGDNPACLGSVSCPVNVTAKLLNPLLESLEVNVEFRERPVSNRARAIKHSFWVFKLIKCTLPNNRHDALHVMQRCPQCFVRQCLASQLPELPASRLHRSLHQPSPRAPRPRGRRQ